MRNIFTFLSIIFLNINLFAQAPEKMSYQVVIRDSDDNLVTSTSVGMQISILQGSISGTPVYVERQFPTTNNNGLISIEIGGTDATVVSGIFSIIDWSSDIYFVKTETDLNGGSNYTITGASQLLSVPYALYAKTSENIPANLEELRDSIEKILNVNKVPGAGIAIVTPDTVWSLGIGYANLEDSVKANENTMFRIGSTSKMFVALAILKLQEEGKVSLKDKVRDLVPEIEFQNKWEKTNPILIEHLLEHTTGWDDWQLSEGAYQLPDSLGIKVGLDYNPKGRISRWIPGTRMSYCNSGPPVAAYIVEKITGIRFETYVQQNFFDPIGMDNMTYYKSEVYKELGSMLYLDSIPQDYWQIIFRPTGGINASAKDMATMIQFFTNRGTVDSVAIVSEKSLKRMELATTTISGKAGIEGAYGLNNYSSFHNGLCYRAHSGALKHGLCDFAYLPEYSVGYTVLLNSRNKKAHKAIIKLIRNFQTAKFQKSNETDVMVLDGKNEKIEGYYYNINPRQELFYFLNKLNAKRFWIKQDTLYCKVVFEKDVEKFIKQKGEKGFRAVETGELCLLPVDDPLDGEVLHIGWHSGQSVGVKVWKRKSGISVYGSWVILYSWLLLLLVSIVWSIIWAIRYWRKKIIGGANIWMRFWPLCASIFILVSVLALNFEASSNGLGLISFYSVLFMLGTILFAACSLVSLIAIIKFRKGDNNKLAYWFNVVLTVLHVIVSVYLFQFGVIGMRLWA